MSQTLVQRFYEVAKQAAEKTALRVEYDGRYHPLPWWFVKSKAKHFGIGLLEAGAAPGDYFYIFPSAHPAAIYAELGALTMGLQSLPLPADLPEADFARLAAQFPPSFIFLGERDPAFLQNCLPKLDRLKRAVSVAEPTSEALPLQSFRKIVNSGIRHEASHYSTYRSLREGSNETQILSPIRIDFQGRLEENPLRFGDVNEAAANLSRAAAGIKIRRLFSDVDFSRSAYRIACLYWPIILGVESALAQREGSLSTQLRLVKPEVACLSERREQELETLLPVTPPPGFWNGLRHRWDKRRFRLHSGGRLHALLYSGNLEEKFREKLAFLDIRSLSLPSPPPQ